MNAFKIWDKQEPINGVEASYVIESYNIKDSDEIFLVGHGDKITEIQFVDTIKSCYEMDINLSATQTAQAYINIKNTEKAEQKNTLVQENELLKQQVAQLTEAVKLVLSREQIERLGL